MKCPRVVSTIGPILQERRFPRGEFRKDIWTGSLLGEGHFLILVPGIFLSPPHPLCSLKI